MRPPSLPSLPLRPTSVPPSYRVVPMADASGAARALATPAVSIVQLSCAAGDRELWQRGAQRATARADTRVGLTAGLAAESGTEVAQLLDASFAHAPETARQDMRRLLRLFARCALAEGGAATDTELAVRLVVSDGVAGACSQLHQDNVALRLSCAYLGPGTVYLEEGCVNRAAYLALQRSETLPGWLRLSLRQPWGWRLHNGLLRWPPWAAERGASEGEAVLMKGEY